VNWLAPSSDPGCAAAATLAAKENAKPKLRAPPPHRMRYHRIDPDRGLDHAGRPAEVWSNADSWVAKPSQAVQYRRD
jgi:hypothetical protein